MWWPIAGVIAMLIGYLVFWVYRVVVPEKVQRWQLPGIGLLGFYLAVGVFTIYLPAKAFFRYHQLLNLIDEGAEKTIQGAVTDFHPYAPGHGSPKEIFTVCGVTFGYDPNAIEPGYHELQRNGSPIANGVHVQIKYVEDTIVQLKICEGQGAISDCTR